MRWIKVATELLKVYVEYVFGWSVAEVQWGFFWLEAALVVVVREGVAVIFCVSLLGHVSTAVTADSGGADGVGVVSTAVMADVVASSGRSRLGVVSASSVERVGV